MEIVPLLNDFGFDIPRALLDLLVLLRLLLLVPTLLEDLVDDRLNFCSHTIFERLNSTTTKTRECLQCVEKKINAQTAEEGTQKAEDLH
jgi:hypothetical protein